MMTSAPCVVIVAVVANGNVVVIGEIIDWSRVPLPLLFVLFLFLFLFLLLNEDENTDDDDENEGDEDDAKNAVVLLLLLSMVILLFLSCRCPSSHPLLVQGNEAALMRETFLSYLFLLFFCCADDAKSFVVIQRVSDVVVVAVILIVSVSLSSSSSSSVSATVLDTYSFRVCMRVFVRASVIDFFFISVRTSCDDLSFFFSFSFSLSAPTLSLARSLPPVFFLFFALVRACQKCFWNIPLCVSVPLCVSKS
jgi:hypothetical protein